MKASRLAFIALLIVFGLALVGVGPATAQVLLDPTTLTKWTDPMPFAAGTYTPVGKIGNVPYYEITASQAPHQFSSQLPPAPVWGYDGQFPGKTMVVRKDQKIKVKWINNLPANPLFPVDHTIDGTYYVNNGTPTPDNRMTVHVHGAHVQSDSDGGPMTWFTPNWAVTGPDWSTQIYTYSNKQPGATLWYHDHAMGITRLNAYAGLAGFWIVKDPLEDRLNLPKGNYDAICAIQDKFFWDNGTVFYPTDTPAGTTAPAPSVQPEMFGNTIVVNGVIWPYAPVEPRKYRFRFLDGSDSRSYNMFFDPNATFHPKMYVIGTEQGLIEKPVLINQSQGLLMMPGMRWDTVLDFTGATPGTNITLMNNAVAPFGIAPDATPPDPNTTAQLIQFRVVQPQGPDTSRLPARLTSINWIPKSATVLTRDLDLIQNTDGYGRNLMQLGPNKVGIDPNTGMAYNVGLNMTDPVTEMPKLKTVEQWRWINPTPDAHPMHTHDVAFQILDRTPIDMAAFNFDNSVVPIGPAVKARPEERGWKDTATVDPQSVTRIIMRWDDYTGMYVWHCHILSHEDNDMMRPIMVMP